MAEIERSAVAQENQLKTGAGGPVSTVSTAPVGFISLRERNQPTTSNNVTLSSSISPEPTAPVEFRSLRDRNAAAVTKTSTQALGGPVDQTQHPRTCMGWNDDTW